MVTAKTEIDQTRAVIANKEVGTNQIVKDMKKIMEGMKVTEKDNAAIRQEVLQVAEGLTRTSGRQEVARINTEAAIANLGDFAISSEERANASLRGVEHRMLRDIKQHMHGMTGGIATRLDLLESGMAGLQQQCRALYKAMQQNGQSAVVRAAAAATEAAVRSARLQGPPATFLIGSDADREERRFGRARLK